MGRPRREAEGRARAWAGLAGKAAGRTGRSGQKEGGERKSKFYFSNLIFQIQFSNIFKYLLNFDSNQSSQKYLCNNMHA
jgi:hypothetical protein